MTAPKGSSKLVANSKQVFLQVLRFVNFTIRILILILISLILLAPLLLAPLTTSTPSYIWIPLGITALFCIYLLFKIKPIRKAAIFMFVGFILIDILTVIASQFFATTPPIRDQNGQPIPGSIASLEKVNLNNSQQWITIRGKDTSKPVLLYLGIGGPGAGGLPATFTSLRSLEDQFVVVNWDQPGTGKSYNARSISSLTTQQFVDDAKALTDLIRLRFKQEKIYVMGLSWGTIVGINLIQQYPELYHAYIGNGQMVNTTENDRFGYELAIKISTEKGDIARAEKLKSYGLPPYEGKGMAIKYTDYNNILFDYMGSANIWMVLALVPQLAREYGYLDKINFDRGLIESFQVLYPQLRDLDFVSQAPKLEVPVYFLVGSKDVNAVASIVERYYNALEAPKKELIWVPSGHGATAEELKDAMVNHVLMQTPN
jgi:pimeloyl-ACP methyl ester carboxylesterase